MFLGTFDYAIDERGRVPLPPPYRDAFRDGAVLSQGSPDKCIMVFSAPAWERYAGLVMSPSVMRRRGKDVRRALLANSYPAQMDAQNRVLVPAVLRAFAGITGKVKMIGAGEHLELWAPETLDVEMERITQTLEATLESIEAWDR